MDNAPTPNNQRRAVWGILERFHRSYQIFAFLAVLLGVASALWWQLAVPRLFFFEMVRVRSGFWVSRCETTQAQYEAITGENPSEFRDPDRPVEGVSWDDAENFCRKLTDREHRAGRLPMDYVYELPTDTQWDQCAGTTSVEGGVTSLGSARQGTERVGTRAPNSLGLCDVVGNVWEWTRDWYNNDVRRRDSNRDLPLVPTDAEAAANGPEETYKVLRGGAWDTSRSDHFDLASRLRYAPGMSNYRTGFRCVVVRDPNAKP